jgi:hypothetical protein
MAEFFTNYPQAQKPMSLGEMLNMAGGVQQYQQAKQMNPLALQKAQMEVEQSKQMNPLTVQKAQEEVSQAKIGTQEKQYGFNEKQARGLFSVIGGIMNDKRLEGDRDSVISALLEAKQRAAVTGTNPIILEGVFAPLMNQAVTKHQTVKNSIGSIIQQEMGAEAKQGLQTPELVNISGAPGTFQKGSGVAKELTFGGQPAGGGGNVSGNATGNAPTGVTATQMELQYPVRRAGDIRPLAPSESEDRTQGQQYRDKLTKTVSSMPTSLRNIDEVIKEAEKIGKNEWNKGSGIAGTLGRNVSTFLGTEQGDSYKRLSKDLAQLQLSLGADTTTDAGKNLLAAANGDITLPPDILVDIAHRSKADRENLSMQAAGAQVFAKKFGDSNMKTYQKLWGDNSKDTRIFEAIAINNSNMTQEEKRDRIDELFKGLTSKQIDKLTQQKNNLIKLSRTGEL